MPRGDGYAPANADVVLAGTSIMRPQVVVFTWQGAEKSAIWKNGHVTGSMPEIRLRQINGLRTCRTQ